jgi:hypothetical protein
MANHRIVYPYHLNLKELRPLFIETEKSSCCPRFRNAEKNKDKIIMTLFAKLVLEKSRQLYGTDHDESQHITILQSRQISLEAALKACKKIDPNATSFFLGNHEVKALAREIKDSEETIQAHITNQNDLKETLERRRGLPRIPEILSSKKPTNY